VTTPYPPDGPARERATAESSELRSLRWELERFRLLVENSHDLIVEVDDDGCIHYVSPNVRTVLGYAPEEMVGTNVFAGVHTADVDQARAQFHGRTGRAIGRFRHRDGPWRWLDTSGREFATPDGEAHRVLIARDVTAQRLAEHERDRLETELARAEKLTALGTLARGIAHDFNNILTGIIAYTSLARMDARQREVIDSLNQVLLAGDRAKNLVQQILTFSRQQKPIRQPVRIVPLVQEVLQLLRPTFPSSLQVFTDLHDREAQILAEPTQIHQVLVNLCSNAVHAMRHRTGRLEVRLSTVTVGISTAFEQPGLQPGRYVRLTVGDNGHGMDAATRAQIFEPFFSTKPANEGTGLGLAVVRQIVTDHEGTIRVTSEPGIGTSFEIFLPVSLPAAPALKAANGQARHGRILVIDDEPDVCATVGKLLEAAGHVVTTCTVAPRALEMLRAHPTAFDVVITDLAMPGLTGVDLAAAALKINAALPILLISGLLDTWSSEKALWIGIRAVLDKPLEPETLLAAVTKALDTPTPPAETT
jgi:PAS domain S-box-containing protein